jgi:ankyrin repeat protein
MISVFLVDETLNDILLNQAPPLRPIGPVDQAQEQVQWISQNETFRKWKSENAASILHVHGSSGVSAVSKYIFDQLRPGEENQSLLYYDFKLHDYRYNNVQAMLSTFLIQLIVHYHDDIETPIAKNLEFLRYYHAWTNEDLYSFWMDLLHHKSSSTITYIINGFDQCTESRSWFLKKLLSTIDKWDRPFKVVITSTGHEHEIQDALADIASSIDLNRPPEHHGIHAHGRRLMTNCQRAGLVYSDSFLCTRERNLDKIISACGSDEPLQWLVMEWLKASNGTNEDRSIDDRLNNLTSQSTIAPDEVLNMILSSVPPQRQCLVRQAIAWVSSSFRPLIKAEFNVILALGEMEERPQEFHDALRKMKHAGGVISRFLAGVFILENNEVRFSHPSAPELFIGGKALPDNDWCIFEREGAAHEVIARSCLSYLSLPEIQIRMATFYEVKDQVERPPLVSEDYGLLQYAVTCWAQHYKHATVSERLSKQAIDFLKNSDSMTCWAKMYHALSNRVTRDDQPFSSALEIVSGFGLEDLMAYFSNEMKEAYLMAFTAAIKNNHTEMALEIFGGLAPTDSLGHNAIMAAASGAYESSLLTLIEHIFSRTSEVFEWPSDLLARGAWLGWGDVVDKLIASGIEVDPPHPLHGMSPLHLAARNNQPGIVKALLQGKANSNVRDESGATPLHTASFYGHDEVVELLIKEGADLEAKQDDDQTALEVACTSGHGKVVGSLAKASPRTRLQDPEFSGPLLSNAIQRGFITICHVLLEAAPHLVDHCDAGCPLFIRAAETDNVALVELLAQRGAEIDVRWTSDRDEGTALYYAARRGSKAMTECLLRLKADPKLSFYGNRTPIYIASHSGHAEIVQLLVDQEVDVNAVTTGAWGPLQVAYDSAPVTRILLQAKAEVDHISQSGTALYLASRWNYIEVVKALLEYHARVDIPCPKEGRYHLATPLIVAVDMGNVEIAKLLLEAGADVNYRKAWKNFALQYAMQSEECMKALLEYSPLLDLVDDDGDTALHCVEAETPVPTIKRLLNAGANPEIVNDMGYTPVCMAILNQNLPVVQYLISKKVRLDFTGGRRGGPLHLACHLASSECIKDLVNGGANVNLCDPEVTGTPLQAFCFRQADWSEEEEGTKQMIEFLIQVGANVNKKGGKLGYPLHAACLRSTPGIIKFLIEKGADIPVEDVMGRNPAQLASLRTTEHVELFDAEEYRRLFSERDALGRTALHYAVVSGRLDLVKRVYDLSGRKVDIADYDGWTPLMWAARTCRQWGTSTFEQTEIIQFLKDEGANLWVRGEGLLNGGWSPLKVARYYEAPTEITRMLVPECKETWDGSFHLTNRGKDPGEHLYCDACLMV